MALTGAQVKQLRSMAHHLNPAIIIGKSDINEGTVEQTVAYLEKHELVKCSVLDGSSLSAREAAEELAERCHAEVVQVIGRKFSLYRESSRKDIEKIKLEPTHSKLTGSQVLRAPVFYRSTSTRLSRPSTKRSYRRRVSGSGTPLTCSLRWCICPLYSSTISRRRPAAL